MAKDALTAHARDELGISEITTARPVQAALTSAATFSVGAAMPLLMVVVAPAALVPMVSAASLASRTSRCNRGNNRRRKMPRRVTLRRVGDGSHRRDREDFRNSYLTIGR